MNFLADFLFGFFRDRTTDEDEDISAGTYALRVLRSVAFAALCVGLYLAWGVFHNAWERRADSATFKDPQPSSLLCLKDGPSHHLIALEPDEARELAEIITRGKPQGVMAVLWQGHDLATKKTAYLLIQTPVHFEFAKALRFDMEGRILNARFSSEDAERLALFVKRVAER